MKLPSRYHDELRYQLDIADVKLSLAMKYDNHPLGAHDVRAATAWRHMIIEELNRVQNEEWDHG